MTNNNKVPQEHTQMSFAIAHPVNVRSLPPKGVRVVILANAKEMQKLAENHKLVTVDSFSSELRVLPWKKRGVRVKAQLNAEIAQACVVTLEPIKQIINEKFEAIFVPADSSLAKPERIDESGELFLDAEGSDIPEVFYGDTLDLGAILEEFFELFIDHYPRKADAEFALKSIGETDEKTDEKMPSPFAILKQLK